MDEGLDYMLDAKGVNVFYGASQILFNLSLSVGKGRTLALLGRNGAGKSPTLKSLAGVVPMKSGTMSLDGNNLSSKNLMTLHVLASAMFQKIVRYLKIIPLWKICSSAKKRETWSDRLDD